MKALLFNILIFAVMYPAIPFGSGDDASLNKLSGKHTKEKKISKSYNVAADALLTIDNSYGNIDVSTWNQNKVQIEVIIKVNGNDEQKVKEKLDEINVKFDQSSEGVFAKTYFDEDKRSWWNMIFGENNNLNMEVNYFIKAPVTNNVQLINDYGNIYLDKLTGNAKINCDYGSIDIGELLGNSNHINIDYSRNSHIGVVKNAVINADYSEFEVEDAKTLDINADYTQSKIRKVEYLKYNGDYGSLSVDKVRKLEGNGDYVSTKIGQVYQSLDLDLDYGSAEINKIMKGAGNVKIKTTYAGVKLGYAMDHPFNFDIQSSYGGIDGMEGLEVQNKNVESTKKSYSGYHLESGNPGNIVIRSTYARITLQKR
ncbi:hypothetical protein JM83_3695 [Gillisia sp. Hel_I_86]|uniref:hypothetical protein n=1 Tax=Gillisia sp. Hel_I_86 TaxID=1249981 RepID=UPI00119A6CB7|nr:hypothetical protein [Gillisia sp. Hel_I_86]TVZ28561.1 hypothetical protein JM83_3695 [Gillisia sp. Hel_I_86]